VCWKKTKKEYDKHVYQHTSDSKKKEENDGKDGTHSMMIM
jgi:hypothetical protein